MVAADSNICGEMPRPGEPFMQLAILPAGIHRAETV
jgi:hypothetical protein